MSRKRSWLRTAAGAAGLALLLAAGGCATSGVKITSNPAGARVILDGKDIGRLTPTTLMLRELERGRHIVTVAKDGYQTENAQELRIAYDGGGIILSVLVPVIGIPLNLIDNLWKKPDPWYYAKWGMPVFEMRKVDGATAPNTGAKP
jgi:hypothetical protein